MHKTRLLAPRHKQKMIATLLILYPSVLLALRGGINGTFLVLELAALVFLVTCAERRPFWDRTAIAYSLAMVAMTPAILVSELATHQLVPQPFDEASRFVAAIPVFLMLREMKPQVLGSVQYGFIVGALAAAFVAVFEPTYYGVRVGSSFLDPIRFGNLALALGALSFLSIDWTGSDALWLKIFKILGLLAGLYVSAVSGSRGGWVALPALFWVWVYYRDNSVTYRTILTRIAASITAALTAYLTIPEIHRRIEDIGRNLTALAAGNPNTSLGERLDLWWVALKMFCRHPLVGVGPNGFSQAMLPLYHRGVITYTVARMGMAEVHSDILERSVSYGVLGLGAILAIYFVPLMIFIQQTRAAHPFNRRAGALGAAFVLAYLIYGLSIEMFDLTMNAAFYSLNVAVLMAAATCPLPGND